jgi:hypothetical protein
MRLRRGLFGIDEFAGERFEGYTGGETWNGFACPRFTKEVAQRIADAIADSVASPSGDTDSLTYDPGSDAFVYLYNADEPDPFPGADVETVDGTLRLYGIGAWGWTWIEECASCGTSQIDSEIRPHEAWDALSSGAGPHGLPNPLAKGALCERCWSAVAADAALARRDADRAGRWS